MLTCILKGFGYKTPTSHDPDMNSIHKVHIEKLTNEKMISQFRVGSIKFILVYFLHRLNLILSNKNVYSIDSVNFIMY